jgi:branched-chain amino acid transport system substrate-binding protein
MEGNWRIHVLIMLFLFSNLFYLGCTKNNPYKVGYVGGLTGRHYDLGVSGRNGITLGIEDINRKGGINGRRVDLVTRDDKQDPEVAVRVVNELIDSGVDLILGHMTSSMSKVTLPVVNKRGILMISPTTSSSYFAEKDDNFIMMHPSTRVSAGFFSNYVYGEMGLRSVAVVYDLSNKTYTESWHENFREGFEGHGGRIIKAVTFTSGEETSMKQVAESLLEGSPDGVAIISGALDAAMICQQIRKLNSKVSILAAEWAFTGDILRQGGSAVEGVVFVQKVDLDSTAPKYMEFKKAYADRFGREPDFAATLAYDAVIVASDALARAKTKNDLTKAIIEKGTYEGLQGKFFIDGNGDVQRRHYIITVKDNNFSVVK